MLELIKSLKISEKFWLLFWLIIPFTPLLLAFDTALNNSLNSFFNDLPELFTHFTIALFGWIGWISMLFVGNDFLEILSKNYAWNKEEEKNMC